MPHPRILIIEDHPLMADAIAVSVRSCLPQAQCTFAPNLQSALSQLSAPVVWALVLVDLNLPDSQGLQTLEAVCEYRSQGALLVLSGLQDAAVEQACVANGVMYLSKALPSSRFEASLLRALHQVLASYPWPEATKPKPLVSGVLSLSTQQRLVLASLAKGWTSQHIAQHLQLSEATVRSHTREILRKLGVDNRTQATQLYLQWVHQKVDHV
jgi:DNA-binding NarL/FixJ family response regulator